MLAQLGHVLLQMGKHSEAERCFSAAVNAQPEHATAWVGLGRAIGASGMDHHDTKRPLINEHKASQADVFCVRQQPAFTRQVTTAGDSMGAMRSYVKALTLQPNQQSTWDSLAIACTAFGDFGLADSADHHDLAAFRRQFVS